LKQIQKKKKTKENRSPYKECSTGTEPTFILKGLEKKTKSVQNKGEDSTGPGGGRKFLQGVKINGTAA